jgi:hypothetical protein
VNTEKPFDLETEKPKLERAAEPHDWAEEIVDDVVEGVASPLTHDDPQNAEREPLVEKPKPA